MSHHASKHIVLLGGGSTPGFRSGKGNNDDSGGQERTDENGDPLRKNSMCNDFLKGSCSRGDACRFFHNEYGPHHGRGKSAVAAKDSVCRDFLRGTCKYGEKCKYAHVQASAVASSTGSAKAGRTGSKDAKREDAAASSSSSEGKAGKKAKPKHLGRKLAALAGASSEDTVASADSAAPAPATGKSAEQEAQIRLLLEQQEQLKQEKQAAQVEWKALVELKLKQTLARKAESVRGELQTLARADTKAKARAAKCREKEKEREAQEEGRPAWVDTHEASRTSALKALQARLASLEPEGWNQQSFDTKFAQLTAPSKGLSRGVLLREIGVDEIGGAKVAPTASGAAAAGAAGAVKNSHGKTSTTPSAAADATSRKRKVTETEGGEGEAVAEGEGDSATTEEAGAAPSRKVRRLGDTITKEKFLKIQAKKNKVKVKRENTLGK